MTLPAGWPAFALLLFLPGFSLLTLVKRRLTMVELIAVPITLSIILFPLAIILLVSPSTALIADFYNNNKIETLATSAEVKAIGWIKENTPTDAVIFEKPAYFVKSPVLAGRDVAYAGQAYTKQYHGIVLQSHMERIMNVTDPASLSKALINDNVDYVFIGPKESKYPYVTALPDASRFKKVYDADGVEIYEVLRPRNG